MAMIDQAGDAERLITQEHEEAHRILQGYGRYNKASTRLLAVSLIGFRFTVRQRGAGTKSTLGVSLPCSTQDGLEVSTDGYVEKNWPVRVNMDTSAYPQDSLLLCPPSQPDSTSQKPFSSLL